MVGFLHAIPKPKLLLRIVYYFAFLNEFNANISFKSFLYFLSLSLNNAKAECAYHF